jgi:nucleotide-binding universal stress UspA family protein
MEYKFKKILIGFDNSSASKIALEKALQTCKTFHSDLYVVNVKGSKSSEENFQAEIEAKASTYGVTAHYMEKRGNVSKEIAVTEREIGADLIFMGAHGVQGFQPYWIGSNANRVVSASSCPVITIQEDAVNADFSNIILPLDDSVETRQKVPYAIVFAKAFNATIHILAVSKDTHADTLRRITAYAHQTEKYLEERGVKYTTEIKQGNNVPQTCIDYAANKKAGLIMMMTETESSGWFMGTYAQQLINHSPTPILSIHSRDLLLTGAAGY